MLPGRGVANKHRQTVTAIDLALKRLVADAICRKCMEQRACRTQARGALPLSKAYPLVDGILRDPPAPGSAPPLRELTDEHSALCENCASQS